MYEYNLVDRIREIYDSCDDREKYFLYKILHELAESEDGRSQTYEDIWLADYKEIPVGINTFLDSDLYLGKTNRNGKAVFPFWRKELNTVFGAGNKYYEWILTGATRIGKTSTANTATSYMTYRLMCLRDPQAFFGKKDISIFSILFFNLTEELAKGVAFREFNDMLKGSPWFCQHGTFSKSERDFYYIPEGGKVKIAYGSSSSHALGQQVFCLVGDTKIVTSNGIERISDLAGKSVEVQQLQDGHMIFTSATVAKTADASVTIRITLEDGTVIEGTPDHRIMLSSGEYKRLSDITEDDDIMTVNSADRSFKVYKHTSPNGKVYIGVTSQIPEHRWGSRGQKYKQNSHFWNAIQKYGWDSIAHEILAENLTEHEALDMERQLVSLYKSDDPQYGYNRTSGGEYCNQKFNAEVIEILRNKSRERWADSEYRSSVISKMIGHPVSEETKMKISKSNKGRKLGHVSPLKGRKISEDHRLKLIGRKPWSFGKTKETDPRLMNMSLMQKGRQFSDSHRAKLSASHKLLHQSGYDPVWVHLDDAEKLVDSKDVQSYLDRGYSTGRSNVKSVYVHKDSIMRKIQPSDVDKYLSLGWDIGRSKECSENIRKSKQVIEYTYLGNVFYSAKSLADYLRENGYPTIVQATVRNIVNGRIIPKYEELSSLIITKRIGGCRESQ